MDKSTVVSDLAIAGRVFGDSALNTIKTWADVDKKLANKRGAMADALHDDGVLSWMVKAPAKGEGETECKLKSGKYTHQQVFDAAKLGVAAGRGKSDLDLYMALPDSLPSNRKPKRTALVRVIGTKVGTDLRRALVTRELQAQLDTLQEEEDVRAKLAGEEPELITKSVLSPTKSDEVRIGEVLTKVIKIAQANETPEYDATEMVKLMRAAFVVIGMTDPTTAA
jgi:hypothetical protein